MFLGSRALVRALAGSLTRSDWPFAVPRSVLSNGHSGRRNCLTVGWLYMSKRVSEHGPLTHIKCSCHFTKRPKPSRARVTGPQTAVFGLGLPGTA